MSFPNSTRPFMMLRFRGGQEQGDIWTHTLQQLREYRAACDEVWFSTGLGVVPLERHREIARTLAVAAAQLRGIGIASGLQIQTTIGHGDSISATVDNSGMSWSGYVGRNGEQCRFVSCPRQPEFLNYLTEVSRIHAAWHPDSVWIDDDLRLQNHWPACDKGGCYCEYCLALFSKEEGRSYTRSELVEACEVDPTLQQRWSEFGLRSLCGIAGVVASAIHEVSPETRLGLQHACQPERIEIFEEMKRKTGRRTGSRPGGDAYSDHDPYAILDKMFCLSQQMAEQSGYDTLDQVCAEIESCPRVFTCKTSRGLRLESLLYLAMGMDSLSYFIQDPSYETPEWYGENLLAPLAAEASSYRAFAAHNQGTLPGGVGLAKPFSGARNPGLSLIGVSAAGFSPYACCRAVTENTVNALSNTELRELLSGNVALNGEAVEALQKRGLSSLIGGVTATRIEERFFEFYTDDPINAEFEGQGHYPFSEKRFCIDFPVEAEVRIVGRYLDYNRRDMGIASLLLARKDGTRIAVLGYDGFHTRYISTARVRFLYRVADWLSHGKLPALPTEPVQCVLIPRVTEQGILRSVTVLNAVIGEQKPFELRLRNVPESIRRAQWQIPGSAPIEVGFRREANGDVLTTIPEIGGWNAGWLKLAED